MISLWDVLKASKGLPVSDFYAAMWGKQIAGKYTIAELEGALPLTFKANGEPLIDYRIYGNTVQDGTPTPENPIMPSGCGERTENLAWTGWAQDFVTRINNSPIARIESIDNRNCLFFVVSAGHGDYDTKYIFSTDWKANTQYTISFEGLRLTTESTSNIMQVWYTDGSNELFPKPINSGNFESYTKTTAAEKTVKYIAALYTSGNFRIDIDTFMVNEGSTPLPYEPYGYKLPILSNSTVTNIYLGESQTTRRIKKLMLTGEEGYNWFKSTTRNYSWYLYLDTIGAIAYTPFYCSHGETVTSVSDYTYGKVYCDNTLNLGIFDSSINSSAELNAYLAQQYAAGTPVTVWYVLAEPETAVVNEPLMKIGDYSDTVSMEQAGVSIPTNKGSTVIDYDGTLKPSEMYIKYLGVKND